jgi:TctA family transporter
MKNAYDIIGGGILCARGSPSPSAPGNLLFAFIGACIGTAIGVLPGLGPPATIALLLPVTYKMDPTSGRRSCSRRA